MGSQALSPDCHEKLAVLQTPVLGPKIMLPGVDSLLLARNRLWAQKEVGMATDRANLTLDELQRRRIVTLVESEKAVLAHPVTYCELKTQIRDILAGPVDVGEYYRRASALTRLLEPMGRTGPGSIFDHFHKEIDPLRCGRARCFRLDCRDLFEHLMDLDTWRAGRRGIRRVK
jgi:hypothetical protein